MGGVTAHDERGAFLNQGNLLISPARDEEVRLVRGSVVSWKPVKVHGGVTWQIEVDPRWPASDRDCRPINDFDGLQI